MQVLEDFDPLNLACVEGQARTTLGPTRPTDSIILGPANRKEEYSPSDDAQYPPLNVTVTLTPSAQQTWSLRGECFMVRNARDSFALYPTRTSGPYEPGPKNI